MAFKFDGQILRQLPRNYKDRVTMKNTSKMSVTIGNLLEIAQQVEIWPLKR